MTHKKEEGSLSAQFQRAVNALVAAKSAAPADQEQQVNLATSLIHDLERRVMKLATDEEADVWRPQLAALQQQLRVASGEPTLAAAAAAAGGSGAALPDEVVGDIDDLFSGMQIAGDDAEEHKTAFVPQGVPGRRYKKVVRSPGAQRPVAVAAAASPVVPEGFDASGDVEAVQQGEVEMKCEPSNEEGVRYKQHAAPVISSPLRVMLPDLPLAAEGTAPAASHGSAGSTAAQRGDEKGEPDSEDDDDDDSITSPDFQEEMATFR